MKQSTMPQMFVSAFCTTARHHFRFSDQVVASQLSKSKLLKPSRWRLLARSQLWAAWTSDCFLIIFVGRRFEFQTLQRSRYATTHFLTFGQMISISGNKILPNTELAFVIFTAARFTKEINIVRSPACRSNW